MMGIKSYQEKMFYDFSLSKRVPENHLLRRLDKMLDLCFVRELVAHQYSHTGQRSIDPEVLFKMMIIGYFYGITSERRLAEDISLNMAYMWYLGYDVDEATPHHSVISKARNRFGREVFEEFFQRILQKCVEEGLVGGEKIFADSTLIKANASLKSLRPRGEAVEPQYGAKEFVEKVFAENPIEDDLQESSSEPPLNTPPPSTSKGLGHLSNKEYISQTDPEATVVSRRNKLPSQLAYKEHFTVDQTARVITAVEVTSSAVGDEAMLASLIEQQPVTVKEVGADSKYGTFENYAFLINRGILPSISPWLAGPPNRRGHFKQEQFLYNSPTDTYLCPNGKELHRSEAPLQKDRWTYYARKRDCRLCPIRSKCISPTLQKRRVFRHIFHDARDQALVHLKTEQAQETLRERKIYAEWINAESKNCHGLRRAKCRGLTKVKVQVLLTASVQNIKRLMKYFQERFSFVRNHRRFSVFKDSWAFC